MNHNTMDTKALRQKILDLAIHGKLVPQDPNDEPSSVLLQRIREEKERLIKEGKIKKGKKAVKAVEAGHCENVPFEVPEAWEWTTLGEIGTWQAGATPSRLQKDYYGGNIPWLKTGDLTDGIITSVPENITEKALQETSVKLNPAGSILIAMYGATIGKVGILSFPATTNQACCACVDYKVEQMFLFYFLLANRNNFIAMGGGGAQPNISKDKIVNTSIPLPPLAEQHRIVAEIERWFSLIDIIENGKESLKCAVKQAKAKILDLAIHGKLVPQDPADEPASDLLRRINPKAEISSDNAQYENVPFEVPESWKWCNIKDVTIKITDGTHNSPVNTPTGDYKYVTAKNIKPNGIVLDNITYVSKEIHDEIYSRCNPEKGDILYIKDGATTGIATINNLNEEFSLLSSVALIKPFKEVSNKFLLYYLQSSLCYSSVRETMKGVGITRVTLKQIEKWNIPLPPLAEQHRIVAKIEELFAQLDLIEAEL